LSINQTEETRGKDRKGGRRGRKRRGGRGEKEGKRRKGRRRNKKRRGKRRNREEAGVCNTYSSQYSMASKSLNTIRGFSWMLMHSQVA